MRGEKPLHSCDEMFASAPSSSARLHASTSPPNAADISAGIASGSSAGRNDDRGAGGGGGDEGDDMATTPSHSSAMVAMQEAPIESH